MQNLLFFLGRGTAVMWQLVSQMENVTLQFPLFKGDTEVMEGKMERKGMDNCISLHLSLQAGLQYSFIAGESGGRSIGMSILL